MKSLVDAELGDLVEDGLSQMMFLMLMQCEEEELDADSLNRFAKIPFESSTDEGAVCISACPNFQRELVASLSGADEEEVTDADVQRDGGSALCEIANVVGGQVIWAMGAEDDDDIKLGLPESSEQAPNAAEWPQRTSCFFESDGGSLRIDVLQRPRAS